MKKAGQIILFRFPHTDLMPENHVLHFYWDAFRVFREIGCYV